MMRTASVRVSCSGCLLDILKIHCKVSPDFDVVDFGESTTGCSLDLDVDANIDTDTFTSMSLNYSSLSSSAPLSQSFPDKEHPNPNLDMTSLLNKLAADNDTNTPDPPTNMEEAKPEVVILVDIY